MFDLGEFIRIAIETGGPVVFLVVVCTTLAGRYGVKGNAQLTVAIVLGFIFGIAAQIARVGMPVTFTDYFYLFLYGLLPGVVASGSYETALDLLNKTAPTFLTMQTSGIDDDEIAVGGVEVKQSDVQ